MAGFDKSKVKCFNCYKMGHFAREYIAPRNQDRGRRDTYRQGSKAEEQTPKALMEIDRVGWDWSYMANKEEDHALRSDKSKEGLGYTDVPPPIAQLYLSPKKDLSWTSLPECADDTATYPTYLILSHLMEDMCLLGKGMQDYRKEDNQNRNGVLFTDSKCIVLRRDFKLLDDANILLRTPRQHRMYSIDLNNIIPHRDLTCLVAKASTGGRENEGITKWNDSVLANERVLSLSES
nr:ribonuclease H-like domain-containing protein [Tanacetum cinerariifolium]